MVNGDITNLQWPDFNGQLTIDNYFIMGLNGQTRLQWCIRRGVLHMPLLYHYTMPLAPICNRPAQWNKIRDFNAEHYSTG